MERIALLLDESRGIYIPQTFAENFDLAAWHVDGDLTEDAEILKAGPDHEHYWEAWDNVLREAWYDDTLRGSVCLEHDGDLFAVTTEDD